MRSNIRSYMYVHTYVRKIVCKIIVVLTHCHGARRVRDKNILLTLSQWYGGMMIVIAITIITKYEVKI